MDLHYFIALLSAPTMVKMVNKNNNTHPSFEFLSDDEEHLLYGPQSAHQLLLLTLNLHTDTQVHIVK